MYLRTQILPPCNHEDLEIKANLLYLYELVTSAKLLVTNLYNIYNRLKILITFQLV